MTVPSRRAVIIGLFLVALAFHLAILAEDFAVLAKNGFLYDDSFYAFKIAQNIALGHGVTFDGVNPTDGFQPLYVFLLVPLFRLSGTDLVAPIYAALAFSALMTAITAVLLYRITARHVRHGVALVVSMLWALSPVVTRQSANGLETSLALMLFAWVVYFYLSRIRGNPNAPRRDFVILGGLVGLAVLGRVDQVFLGLVILLDYLLVVRRERYVGSVGSIGAALASAAIVYSPWLLFSYFVVGNLFQDSGSATRFLSLAYAPFFNLGSADLLSSGPTAAFIWGHIVKAFAILKVAPPIHALFRGIEKLGGMVGLANVSAVIGNVLGFALLGSLLWLGLLKRNTKAMRRLEELRFLPVLAIVLIAAYSFYVFGVFFFIRYLYPIYFIACIFAAVFVDWGVRRLRASRVPVRRFAAVALTLYACAFAFMAFSAAFRSKPVYFFYDVAEWVKENTAPEETIGVFQGGAVGYLSERKVVNLDGKVNRDALGALKGKRLAEYLKTEGVDVVLDNSSVLDIFLRPSDWRDLMVIGFDDIMGSSKHRIPGWSAYRIHRQGDMETGAATSSIEGPVGGPRANR